MVNASPNMGAADVYIVNVGSSISGAKPVASGLAVNQATAYQLETIGNFQVFMTQPGTTNVYLNSGPLALTQSQFLTVVAVECARAADLITFCSPISRMSAFHHTSLRGSMRKSTTLSRAPASKELGLTQACLCRRFPAV